MIVAVGNPVYDNINTPYTSTGGRVLSGCSTNTCIIDSLLGMKCALTGCVGEDFRHRFEEDLASFKIEHVVQPSGETGGFDLDYDVSGDRKLNLLGIADPIKYFPEKYLSADTIVIGPILGEVSYELLRDIRDKADGLIFLDPQGFVRQIRDKKAIRIENPHIKEIVASVDIVKPNEYEAKIMTGFDAHKETKKICETLYSWGANIAIVTLGEAGSMIYDGDEFIKIPAYETFAKDPTGAGDTYMGGFIFEYFNKKDLLDVGLFASCTSSIVVENVGPNFPITEGEIRRRVEVLKDKYNL